MVFTVKSPRLLLCVDSVLQAPEADLQPLREERAPWQRPIHPDGLQRGARLHEDPHGVQAPRPRVEEGQLPSSDG